MDMRQRQGRPHRENLPTRVVLVSVLEHVSVRLRVLQHA
jgi:hypothetical protein